MIYTVTLNPSLDYIVSVEQFKLGVTNRTDTEKMLPGGKGINVSVVLQNLGMESTALGFLAGFTGKEIKRLIDGYGIRTDFIQLADGNSRINLKLKSIDGTEINGMGPDIPEYQLAALRTKLRKLQAGDVLVLAGSIPGSIPSTIYSEILQELSARDILCVVDATKTLLTDTLQYHPFLIKPNDHELGELFHVTLSTRQEVIPYAKKLQEMGAVNVLVSMAGQGAVLVDAQGGIHESPAPKGKLINAVGAGDSMVAGFLAGWLSSRDYRHAFLMGLSAGSASAFSEELATAREIEAVYQTINQEEKE